ncbi:4-(cytidine 5'-diphospho)-2-C-methyl-D-erythritol kinase [Aquabacterium sp. J223]|uniref:4-(cytidine 5'-diphospho)-2-C-methyl-D-erythritol kinase n=1 Tax=Aquabacterium sp. J223 TaxID=2898431 RepID=UPI0021ADDEBB|nr:4-(cytidine 5'-diphospho)-2-C-methyl-D-erythritol kinase [Aquabacterium sp. J223]UUX96581.1 4-(cytidine 5'-diphospho)-2-C-methyl-D-erythritol kinase [Aquabacterium sp. J223]
MNSPLGLYELPAPAKLNLFLHVTGRRDDGYHLLQSVFVLLDWCDTVHLELRRDGALRRHDLAEAVPEDDLCLRAARALQQASGCALGVDIHLHKRLPSGAGLGGGSSDAATVLLGLNRLWGLRWPRERLLALGLTLGADVPFFIGGDSAFVEGIGERLTPLPTLAPMHFAVVKPPAHIATADIFRSPQLVRNTEPVIVTGFPADASGFGRNDLEPAAKALEPQVGQALEWLTARFGNARMTGSGSAVFARLLPTARYAGEGGTADASSATGPAKRLQDLPPGWVGRMCRSLDRHPLRDWSD